MYCNRVVGVEAALHRKFVAVGPEKRPSIAAAEAVAAVAACDG